MRTLARVTFEIFLSNVMTIWWQGYRLGFETLYMLNTWESPYNLILLLPIWKLNLRLVIKASYYASLLLQGLVKAYAYLVISPLGDTKLT